MPTRVILLLSFFILSFSAFATEKHHISIKKFKFSPAQITINEGDTIRWTNTEKRQYHSVWFEQSGEPEPDYFFPDEFYEKTFTETGSFPYRCGPHPKMTGVVEVIAATQASSEPKTTYTAISVEDGDTILISYKGKDQRVQLIGIDAPESVENPKFKLDAKKKQISHADLLNLGELSTNHLKTLVESNSQVQLLGNLTQKDKYNRLPAIVVNENGESLNLRMVADGYALLLTRFSLKESLIELFSKAQEQAKSDKKGLWGSHQELMEKWSQ